MNPTYFLDQRHFLLTQPFGLSRMAGSRTSGQNTFPVLLIPWTFSCSVQWSDRPIEIVIN